MYYNKEKNKNVEELIKFVEKNNFDYNSLFYLKFSDNEEYICKFLVFYDEDEDMDMNDPNYEFYYELSFLDITSNKGIAVNYKHFPIEIKMGEEIIYPKNISNINNEK